MGAGVGLKDHASSVLGDNSSSSARNPNKIRSKTREGAAVDSAGVAAAHRAQASAAPRDGNDPPPAEGDQPAPRYHQPGQLWRTRSCGDLDPLAGRYILFTTVLRNIRLLRCTSGSM